MKILFLTPWYPDSKNPTHGIFVLEQASAVSEMYDTVVISSKVDYSRFGLCKWSWQFSKHGNLQEYRLVVNRSLPVLNQVVYLLASIFFTLRIARILKPDIIHGNIGYPGGIWSYALSKMLKVPYLVTEHYSRFEYNFRSALHKSLTLFALRRAQVLLTVSTHSAANIKRYVNRPVQVLPNMIDTNRFQLTTVKSSVLQIGFLGGLSSPTHQKGLDVLLKALSQVEIDFMLHIGGGGPMIEQYQEMATQLGLAEKCKFYGHVPYDAIPAFMAKLHFFASPSRFESFGIAMIEAMAAGLPVLASNSGGPADFVFPDNGILVESGSVDSLTEGLLAMKDKLDSYDREFIRAFVINMYSKKKFLSEVLSIYKNMTNQQGN
jgi:L-malate glycosyltransferase